MITPATTGTTRTRAAVATLRWGAERQHGGAQPHGEGDPDQRSDQTLCAPPHCRTESGPPAPAVPSLLRVYSGHSGRREEPVKSGQADTRSMADFLAVLGIVGFVVAMLGLIWALDRV